jgi:hypothetical protein
MSPFLGKGVRLTCGDIQADRQSNENFKQLESQKKFISTIRDFTF